MAMKDGTDVVLKLATTLVNGLVTNNIDFTVDEIDITTKDSAGDKEFIAGEFGGVMNIEGKLDEADAYSFSELLTALQAKAAVAFVYGDDASASKTWTGNCILTALSQAAPKNGAVTFNCTARITGAVVEATLA